MPTSLRSIAQEALLRSVVPAAALRSAVPSVRAFFVTQAAALRVVAFNEANMTEPVTAGDNVNTFGEKDPLEVVDVSILMADALAGKTASSASWTCEVYSGSDPDPGALLEGVGSVLSTTYTHRVKLGRAGVTYRIKVFVTCTDDSVIAGTAFLPVKK